MRQSAKSAKNPLKPIIQTRAHQITSQTTLAILRSILRGAAELLESISRVSYIFAYSLLYRSENVAIARGMAAAYQIELIIPNIITKTILSDIQNHIIDTAETTIPARIILSVV